MYHSLFINSIRSALLLPPLVSFSSLRRAAHSAIMVASSKKFHSCISLAGWVGRCSAIGETSRYNEREWCKPREIASFENRLVLITLGCICMQIRRHLVGNVPKLMPPPHSHICVGVAQCRFTLKREIYSQEDFGNYSL